jgi:hypothetical protein
MNKGFAIIMCTCALMGHINAKQPNVVFILDDPGERNDLAAAQPERVKKLAARLELFLKETSAVIPIKNPAYDPNAKPPKAKKQKTPDQSIRMKRNKQSPDEAQPTATNTILESISDGVFTVGGIAPEALSLLMAHDWPGNVRELESVIERAFIL